jgi:hypothetical protein
MYYDMFISHNEETELNFAIRIKEKLWDKRKIKAFVAKKDIPPDTNDWDKFTTDAIKNSASVLVLYDDGAVNSSMVKGEIIKADKFKRKIIIFKEEKVARTDIPLNIVASQQQSFDIDNPEDLINQVLEMRWQKNPNTEPEFHDLYEEANRYSILNPYLFSWDNVSDNDSEKLREYLRRNLGIGWAENAEIRKSYDGKSIQIFKDENSAEIKIDEKKEKATLKISSGKTYGLKVKKEKGKLNIHNPSLLSDIFLEDIKNKLAYTFEYRSHERLPSTIKYYTELKDLVNKMLEDGEIEKTEEYVVLERKEGTKKALHILSVGIWKEGIHKGIL